MMAVQPLAKFLKFPKLCDNLRDHVLSYADRETLLNYSQCAEQCNADIQKFRTKAPDEVSICENVSDRLGSGSIVLTLDYLKPTSDEEWEFWRTETSSFEFSDVSSYDEAIRKIEEYLSKTFKYVKKRKTDQLKIDVAQWPTRLLNRGFFLEVNKLTVHMWNSMFENFIEYARTTELRPNHLTLKNPSDPSKMLRDAARMRVVLQSELFQQMQSFGVETECQLNDEDVMGLQNPNVWFDLGPHVISIRAIRQKVDELNSTGTVQRISISTPFHLRDLYPLEYEVEYERARAEAEGGILAFNPNSVYQVTIGTVSVMLAFSDLSIINGDRN